MEADEDGRKLVAPDTPFVRAIEQMMKLVEATFPVDFAGVVRCYLAGGCAVHLYTGARVSTDLDAAFVPRLLLADTPLVTYPDEDGRTASVILDRNYTDVLAMMHPDWQADARHWLNVGRIAVSVISPIDLAVSKVARFGDTDRSDIRDLANKGLLTVDEFEQRCAEARDYYVGDMRFVTINIAEAAEIIRGSQP